MSVSQPGPRLRTQGGGIVSQETQGFGGKLLLLGPASPLPWHPPSGLGTCVPDLEGAGGHGDEDTPALFKTSALCCFLSVNTLHVWAGRLLSPTKLALGHSSSLALSLLFSLTLTYCCVQRPPSNSTLCNCVLDSASETGTQNSASPPNEVPRGLYGWASAAGVPPPRLVLLHPPCLGLASPS